MAARAEDAWKAMTLMLEGLECQVVHKKERQFGRRVGALETCCLQEGHKCWRNWCPPAGSHNFIEYMVKSVKGIQ